MGTVLENLINTKPHTPAIGQAVCREGDWDSYMRAVSQTGVLIGPDVETDALDYKRQCAIDYLGKRALIHGGVCSRTVPRILTQQFVAHLEKSNRSERYTRYPWLEKLMKLFAEIEAIQDQHASNNVISLVKPAER